MEKSQKQGSIYQRSLKKSGHKINKFIKVNKYINRPLAFLIVKAVFKTKITPNQISFISFLIAVTASFFFLKGTPFYFVIAGILVQLSSIVDCADGQLARARNQCSEYGAYLDLFFDRVGDFLILSSLAYGYFIYSSNLTVLIIGLIAAGMYLLQVNLYYLVKSYLEDTKTGETGEARSFFLLFIMISAIFNRLDVLIYFVLGETVINCFSRLVYFISLGVKKNRGL